MAVIGQAYQEISDDYFVEKDFPQNSTNNIIFKMYRYSEQGVFFRKDLSAQVIDYSYDCDCSGNIRQTASVTLKVDTDDETWYMRRENKMYDWVGDDKVVHSLTWTPVIYQIIKTYSCADDGTADNPQQLNLGFFLPVSDGYTYDSTTGTISISLQGLSAILTKEYGGSVLAARVGTTTIDPDTHQPVTKTLPLTLSIDKGVDINNQMFYELAMGSYAHIVSLLNITAQIPLVGCVIENGQKLYSTPYDIEFDADVGRMDMIEQVLDVAFEGATCWVDENRYLRISAKPTERGELIAKWSDYSPLFISESVSYNDSNFFNVTEVYGKDNSYYAICDEAALDGGYASYMRKQILKFDELTSVEECQSRANWENYKARFGRQSISVTLVDRYIPQFVNPSTKVGKTIEYTTVDGDTNLYFLNKLSYSNNTWTMELSLFKPLYDTPEIRKNYTLAMPTIVRHEVINNNTLRLYVTSEDIKYGAVKIYMNNVAMPTFKAIGSNTDGDYKYVDIPISQNGTYYCYAALYSPYFEDSPIGGTGDMLSYVAEVTELVGPAVVNDPDPYPHRGTFTEDSEHKPYIITPSLTILTNKNGDRLTT